MSTEPMQLKDFIKADHHFDLEDQIPMVSTGKMRLPPNSFENNNQKNVFANIGNNWKRHGCKMLQKLLEPKLGVSWLHVFAERISGIQLLSRAKKKHLYLPGVPKKKNSPQEGLVQKKKDYCL